MRQSPPIRGDRLSSILFLVYYDQNRVSESARTATDTITATATAGGDTEAGLEQIARIPLTPGIGDEASVVFGCGQF